ncbi:MAG: hypothetical protein JSS40_09380 [Proteobacteria bacterium]|nr:hypothetical protein [Pseudomonadota bacterium]
MRPGIPEADDLPPPPRPEMLRIAGLGEPATLARMALLYLQTFDYHGTNALPYRKLDYHKLIGWLDAIQQLDPLSEYPLFISTRVYADVQDPNRQRMMLEFIYEQFLLDPNRRWQWAAHAALVAKHRLKDLPLALKYAKAVDKLTTVPDVPLWAKQMEIFILEDMNELEAARIMLGGLLEAGPINDPGERRFLENRLREMEQRLRSEPSSNGKAR